jgi:hypothetical protein
MIPSRISAELIPLRPASRSRVFNAREIRPFPPVISVAADQPFSLSCRTFHASSTNSLGHSYNDESTVPDFYIRRKELKAQINEALLAAPKLSEDERNSLMDQLSEPSHSSSELRRLVAKLPRELFDAEGRLVHPSGFVIPTPAIAPHLRQRKEREKDKAQQTTAIAERVQEGDFSSDFSAEIRSRKEKVPFEVAGENGTVSHPSGFIPPTPSNDFWSLTPPPSSAKPNSSEHSRSFSSSSSALSSNSNHTTAHLSEPANLYEEQQSSASPTPSGTTTPPNLRSSQTDPISALETAAQTRAQERKELEGGLMSELTAGILSRGISASTEPRKEKVPPEITVVQNGSIPQPIQHPSGFIPPAPNATR